MRCYDYEEYNFDKSLLNVDATYIIHLEGNGRYESIIDQLNKYPISKKVYILLNKGYKKCKKNAAITKPPLDLIDAFLEIFNHAKNKKNILILEDDFIFDDKILEPFHQNNLNYFIKEKQEEKFVYYIGVLPLLLIPYNYYNYIGFTCGTHSVIYSKKMRESILNDKSKKSDWDVYINSNLNRFVYYTPMCYQIFSETENATYWGSDYTINLAFILKFILKLFNLDKSIDAYPYFYFVSKLWFLLFLIIIWILLTFFISLKM